MVTIDKKDWCILIYANGNNELAPEMWQVKQMAERIGADQNVHVVLQLSLGDRKLVKLFRPDVQFPEPTESWTGVKRYYVQKGHSLLQEDLGLLNMANPLTLYEFLKWAIQNYPAHQHMLILGGHGYQFVGAMTDYNQKYPYIMGIPGMSKAIQMACNESGCKIDLLVLDICYFNFIEVMYEFEKNSHVYNVLTYLLEGPIQGLPVDQIIYLLQNNTQNPSRHIASKIINAIPFQDLVAVEINHSKLENIKQDFHQLARTYLAFSDQVLSMMELLLCSNPDLPWYPISKNIINNIASLIIDYKKCPESNKNLINVANFPCDNIEKLELYNKLAFAKDNDWTYLLSGKTRLQQQKQDDDLEPTVLKPEALFAYISIMNKHKSLEERKNIYKELIDYKGWFVRCADLR